MGAGAGNRTPDDPLAGLTTGRYIEVRPTGYTRGSEARTSRRGTAHGHRCARHRHDKSIATTEEIDAKEGEAERKPPVKVLTAADKDPGGITGTAEIGTAKDSDFQLRETPDGWALGFRLVSDKGGIKVIAFDAMAQALAASVGETVGKRVTVWGRIKDESFTNKGGRKISYQVLQLERSARPNTSCPPPWHPGRKRCRSRSPTMPDTLTPQQLAAIRERYEDAMQGDTVTTQAEHDRADLLAHIDALTAAVEGLYLVRRDNARRTMADAAESMRKPCRRHPAGRAVIKHRLPDAGAVGLDPAGRRVGLPAGREA